MGNQNWIPPMKALGLVNDGDNIDRPQHPGGPRPQGGLHAHACPPRTSPMLKIQRPARRIRKLDWYPQKIYLHFDVPLTRPQATALVTNPAAVKGHSFLPLMAFDKRERRYRRMKNKPPSIKWKVRKLAYCSNRDACIFSYYANLLTEPYEKLIKQLGIDDVVIGYRKLGSNIDLAFAAFTEIKTRGSCVAFAYDISGFFDNMDHGVLKRNWCRVLGTNRLPDGHFTVFERLTKFSSVNRRACLRRLGEKPSAKDGDIKRRPLCSIDQYRRLIRGGDGVSNSLVVPWKKDYRIPQGTPISALAANISMIDFDVEMRRTITALGGSYRRYSDDILIIVPAAHRAAVPDILESSLKLNTRRLKVNLDKADEIEFGPGSLAKGLGTKALQYLGFIFDGQRQFLRSSTLAKYYRRVHRAVGWAKRQQIKVIKGKAAGRVTLHRRRLLANLTHLGSGNFVTTYGADAQAKMGGGIRQQLSRHPEKLKSLMSRKMGNRRRPAPSLEQAPFP
jgi:RNA-directed DNA polymerase